MNKEIIPFLQQLVKRIKTQYPKKIAQELEQLNDILNIIVQNNENSDTALKYQQKLKDMIKWQVELKRKYDEQVKQLLMQITELQSAKFCYKQQIELYTNSNYELNNQISHFNHQIKKQEELIRNKDEQTRHILKMINNSNQSITSQQTLFKAQYASLQQEQAQKIQDQQVKVKSIQQDIAKQQSNNQQYNEFVQQQQQLDKLNFDKLKQQFLNQFDEKEQIIQKQINQINTYQQQIIDLQLQCQQMQVQYIQCQRQTPIMREKIETQFKEILEQKTKELQKIHDTNVQAMNLDISKNFCRQQIESIKQEVDSIYDTIKVVDNDIIEIKKRIKHKHVGMYNNYIKENKNLSDQQNQIKILHQEQEKLLFKPKNNDQLVVDYCELNNNCHKQTMELQHAMNVQVTEIDKLNMEIQKLEEIQSNEEIQNNIFQLKVEIQNIQNDISKHRQQQNMVHKLTNNNSQQQELQKKLLKQREKAKSQLLVQRVIKNSESEYYMDKQMQRCLSPDYQKSKQVLSQLSNIKQPFRILGK